MLHNAGYHCLSIFPHYETQPKIYLTNWKIPIKMCIETAPYLHQKGANRALNMILFYAMVLILLTKFVPKKGCSSSINISYYDEFAPNIEQICPKKHHSRKFVPYGTIKVLVLKCTNV